MASRSIVDTLAVLVAARKYKQLQEWKVKQRGHIIYCPQHRPREVLAFVRAVSNITNSVAVKSPDPKQLVKTIIKHGDPFGDGKGYMCNIKPVMLNDGTIATMVIVSKHPELRNE